MENETKQGELNSITPQEKVNNGFSCVKRKLSHPDSSFEEKNTKKLHSLGGFESSDRSIIRPTTLQNRENFPVIANTNIN